MLLEISIKNYVIIEHETIHFKEGLNIITGETGSGKSLVIDALAATAGGKFSKEDIRNGTDKAIIEALFNIENNNEVLIKLDEYGIDKEEDQSLLISREVNLSGKSVCRINGQTVTLSMLKRITENLVDIVGQNEHQLLFNVSRHIDYLDSLDKDTILPAKNNIAAKANEIKLLEKKLNELSGSFSERERRLDLFRFQIDDIENANLKLDEDENLKSKRIRLINAEKLYKGVTQVYKNIFKGDAAQTPIIDLMNECLHALNDLSSIDNNLDTYKTTIENALYPLEDIKNDLRLYRDEIEFNDKEIESIEERLDLINKLKRKYGSTIEAIFLYKDEIKKQYEELQNSEKLTKEIEAEIRTAKEAYIKIAIELSAYREKAARKLEKLVEKELCDMNMTGARFVIKQSKDDSIIAANGIDKVEFMISPNPGEPEKPLVKIASGGEISRVMLSIKNVLTEHDKVPCIVFDEVDAGIGGLTAKMVGQKIKVVSGFSQVICITHLPQIASYSDNHIYIDKIVENDKTFVKIKTLDKQEKIEELARMIGGNAEQKSSIKHVKDLLKNMDN